jgi:hypothetical protein
MGQGDNRSICHCWNGDFYHQGSLPPGHHRHCWPGRHGGRLGGAGQGEPRDSPTRRGIGNPTAGRSCYPGLSDKKGGNTPLRREIALHVARQLMNTRFPKLVRRSPHRRERDEGANGGQGLPEVVHTLGCQVRAMGRHSSITSPSLFPCRADTGTPSARSPELDGRRSTCQSSILVAGSTSLALERLSCGGILPTLALGRGSVWLRIRRLCDTRGGQRRGMPHCLLSSLPCQINGTGHPPPLVRQGSRAGRTIFSLRHGQSERRDGVVNEANEEEYRPLPRALDVTGAFTDTGGKTP